MAMRFLCLIVLIPTAIFIALGIVVIAAIVPNALPQLLSMVIMTVQGMIVVFGAAQYVSMLFFSKDSEMLMAMPIKPQTVFLSKFITVYLSYLLVAFTLQFPATIALGVVSGAGAAYYIIGLFAVLFTPAIPLLIISILAIPLAYIAGYFRRNNLAGTISAIIAFSVTFGGYLYLVMSVIPGVMGAGAVDPELILQSLDIVSKIIYPNLFLASAMLGSGVSIVTNLAIYLAIIISAFVLTTAMSAYLYKNLSTRFLEVGVLEKVKVKSNVKTSSVVALIKRDVKCTLSEAALSFNYLIGLIFIPVMVIVSNLSSITGEVEVIGKQTSLVISALISILMMTSTNYWAIFAYSREGKNIGLLKMMPVSSMGIIKSKTIVSDAYNAVIVAVCVIILLALGLNWLGAILYMISAMLINMGIGSFQMQRDLKSPRLNWNNLKELMRNNLSSLFGVLFALPILLVSITTVVFTVGTLTGVSETNVSYLISVAAFVPALIAGLIYFAVFRYGKAKKAAELYKNIE